MNVWRHTVRVSTLLALAAVLVLCAACEGGTSGSVTGSRQRCSSRGGSGSCSGSFKKLSGTYGLDIENDRVFSKAEVEIQASVVSGPSVVYVKTPDDEVKSVDIPAGGSGTLSALAKGRGGRFDVYFQAVEEQAEGIKYEITYKVP